MKQRLLLKQQIELHIQKAAGIYSLELIIPNTSQTIRINPARLPSASLIKVFIMAEAFRRSHIGSLDLNFLVAVTPDVRVGGAGPLEHAPFGTRLPLQELIELMITESDNTATNMLIQLLGMDAINTLARRLGCGDTFLGRKMMDFAARDAGKDNFTSPTDMNILFSRLYAKSCIDPVSDQIMLDILLRQTDKCKLPLLLQKNTLIAHKTGELDGIEHDSGIVFAPVPYILTIMTEQLPDEAAGRQTIAELSRLIYDALQ